MRVTTVIHYVLPFLASLAGRWFFWCRGCRTMLSRSTSSWSAP